MSRQTNNMGRGSTEHHRRDPKAHAKPKGGIQVDSTASTQYRQSQEQKAISHCEQAPDESTALLFRILDERRQAYQNARDDDDITRPHRARRAETLVSFSPDERPAADHPTLKERHEIENTLKLFLVEQRNRMASDLQ